MHGPLVKEMWETVQARTCEVKFGSILRKLLLSGTEWVSVLSYGIMQHTPTKNSSPKLEKETK